MITELRHRIEGGITSLVFHQNLHGVYLQRRDPLYRRLYRECSPMPTACPDLARSARGA
ncbi:MAG: hypothetical protein R2710_19210 [Acidimicrobiales bacterium]